MMDGPAVVLAAVIHSSRGWAAACGMRPRSGCGREELQFSDVSVGNVSVVSGVSHGRVSEVMSE